MKNRVLIVYYSFTQQTRLLVKSLGSGLREQGVEVQFERLIPQKSYGFPFKSNFGLARAMTETFFRKRTEINDLSDVYRQQWDCVVIAGPTWSYHPSGPVLEFLDQYGSVVCRGQKIVALISCRSYWKIHYWSLRHTFKKYGAAMVSPLVFEHPTREPYRFIGLVLQLRGKMIRREKSWFRKHYPGYGHDKKQLDEAFEQGLELGRTLTAEKT